MKLTCSKESILKILNVADNVISTKTSISILSNILLEAFDSKIKITACETKINFFGDIGADITEEGAVSVHCNKFYSIIRKLPGNEIIIESDNTSQIHIKPKDNDNINYTIKGLEANKFPQIKVAENSDFFSISQEIIADMIKRTIFAVSETDNRRFVSGIYFEISDKVLKMVSTDGKRLSMIKNEIDINSKIKIENGVIIPPKILIETLKLCSGNGDVQISINNKEIYIKINNFSFISNLLEGNFPPYEKVIPFDQSIVIPVNRKSLFESLDRISQISDKESHKITMSLNKDKMVLYTEDITIGSGEEVIPVEYKKEEFKISLNSIFITDVLNVSKNDNVILEFKDANTTVTVKEENNDNFIYIMMPMTS